MNCPLKESDDTFRYCAGNSIVKTDALTETTIVSRMQILQCTSSRTILNAEENLGNRISSSIGYTYGLRTLDSGLNPDAGVLFRFSQDLAGLGGDAEYIETTALFVAERKLLTT